MIKIALLTVTVTAAVMFAAQTPSKTIWVLGANPASPSITALDPANFTTVRTITVPKQAVQHPEYFSVNFAGQMLFVPTPGVEFGDGNITTVWFFDNNVKPSFPRQEREDWPRAWFLARSGGGMYAFDNRHTRTLDKDGNDATVRTSAQLMRRGATETALTTLVELPALPVCKCTTGVCSESCPQWQVWAPDDVIGDLFLATKYVEGQLQSDVQETRLFRYKGGWTSTTLAEPIEAPVDATSDARIIIGLNPDAACCGNINESSDQLLMWRDGTRTVLYDEWMRFKNSKNEDVSFAATLARLAPAGRMLAYTIAAYPPEKNTSEMPLTEIVDLNQPANRIKIPRVEMAGWINDAELLVVEDGKLVTYDTKGARRRVTNVEAKSAASVFVR